MQGASGGNVKTHMDYAYELDLVVKPDSRAPLFEREYAAFTGAGVPLFSLGGGYYRYALIDILARFHARRGYFIAETPIIASTYLYQVSGHLDFFRQNMFLFKIEDHDFAIKPMNCPYHILIFLSHLARYRQKVRLPFKIFEAGRVHRYEPSGSLYGLLRVRAFTQDDAHIITPEDKAVDSLVSVFEEMKLLLEKLFLMNLDPQNITLRLSLSDKEKIGSEFMGTRREWEASETALEEAAKTLRDRYGFDYYKEEGEAAFYGPKIDVIMRVEESGIEKEWQLGTAQFDFNLPRRFKVYDAVREIYGSDTRVFIIHRALMGSIERFLSVYLDYAKGRMPFTLSPVQFAVVAIKVGDPSVDEKIAKLAESVHKGLISEGYRSGIIETTKTSLSGEVRRIESTIKPAVTVYIGAREAEEGYLTIRPYIHSEKKRISKKVSIGENPHIDVIMAVKDLEEGIVELAGYPPRIPGDVSHLL